MSFNNVGHLITSTITILQYLISILSSLISLVFASCIFPSEQSKENLFPHFQFPVPNTCPACRVICDLTTLIMSREEQPYASLHYASLAAFPLLLVPYLSIYLYQRFVLLQSSLHLNSCQFSFPREERIVPLIFI